MVRDAQVDPHKTAALPKEKTKACAAFLCADDLMLEEDCRMTREIRLSGVVTVGAGAMWLVSEIMELIAGGFGTVQLGLTFAAFVLLPIGIIGVHAFQSDRGGILSLAGTLCFGISFIIFSGFTLLEMNALGAERPGVVAAIYQVGIILNLVGCVALGVAVVRSGVLPRWAGGVLVISVVIYLLAPALSASMAVFNVLQMIVSVALMHMGWVVWSEGRFPRSELPSEAPGV